MFSRKREILITNVTANRMFSRKCFPTIVIFRLYFTEFEIEALFLDSLASLFLSLYHHHHNIQPQACHISPLAPSSKRPASMVEGSARAPAYDASLLEGMQSTPNGIKVQSQPPEQSVLTETSRCSLYTHTQSSGFSLVLS